MPGKPAIIHLVRHGQSTANARGILAGRDNAVKLSERGEAQSRALARHLNSLKIFEIYSSPILRCKQTLKPFSTASGKELMIIRDMQEMDYGSWSGKRLMSLAKKPLWAAIQKRPSSVRFPDGESFLEMHARAVLAIHEVATPGKEIVICTHGDVIKMLLAHFSGAHIDSFQRWNIDPASLSTIAISNNSATILTINETSYLAEKTSTPSSPQLGGGAGAKLIPGKKKR